MHVISEKGNMKHKKDYPAAVKLLFWLPAACIAAAIFWFSAQPAAESTDERHRKPLNSFTRHKARLFPRKSGAVR